MKFDCRTKRIETDTITKMKALLEEHGTPTTKDMIEFEVTLATVTEMVIQTNAMVKVLQKSHASLLANQNVILAHSNGQKTTYDEEHRRVWENFQTDYQATLKKLQLERQKK